MDDKPLVLIVDDEISHLRLMEIMLVEVGCEIVTAEHPREALAVLKARTPSLIIMDVNMPGLSGIALSGRIRGVKRLQRVPIILVASQLTPELRELAKWEDLTTVLEKPLTSTRLQARVRQALAGPPARQAVPA
ncbi:MAG TPA: response regulator [Trueperaceae bacterium]